MSKIQLTRVPIEIKRSADDLPSRVLYLTFEEHWVFTQLLEQAKTVFDGSVRYAISEDDNIFVHQLKLKPGEIKEVVLRDIVERLEAAKIIERVGKTGKGKSIAYKLTYNPEDIVVIEINSRPNLTVPKQYMKIVSAMLAGNGPDPNLTKALWTHAFTSWVRTVGYHDDNIKTLMYKIRGYSPKDLTDLRSMSNRWGIWYHYAQSDRWLLAFEQFLPLAFNVINKPPSRRFRKTSGEPTVDVSPEPQESASQESAVQEPVTQVPIVSPSTVPTSVDDPIAHIKSELYRLDVRNKAADIALNNIKKLERTIQEARDEHSRLALSLEEKQRLADLVTTLRVLKSIS